MPDTSYRSYEDYLVAAGRSAIPIARELSADAIVKELTTAGLRGRGGAGFPTGVKWRTVLDHPCPIKYVVCNAAEGEPGTFKDRFLLRKNPYAVIEGLAVAARVVSAERVIIALKASFTREIERVRGALEEMRGALGDVSIGVVEGPEEYLFGEEKALLNVIEGEGPLPRDSDNPPYEIGLFATPGSPNPAIVNNAETFAHVPSILVHGAASFREIGTADTPGTVLYTISGDVERPGIYERPAGTTLRELIFDAASGPLEGHSIKMVLCGVSAAPIPPEKLDIQADFGHLSAIGSGLGSAGFVVYDDRRSAARVAQAVARFLYVESCNQCSACKTNLGIASSTLDEAATGAARPDIAERAMLAARRAPQANRCYLPVQGSIVIPALIKRFRSEIDIPSLADEVLIPKMVDYDEETHTFEYDNQQRLKQPSWTYRRAPIQTPQRTTLPSPVPIETPHDVIVTLDPDVAAALHRIVDDRHVSEQVNAALREWLQSRPRA